MAKEIVVPTLGESVASATVAKWNFKTGDAVKEGDSLVELETDKVTMEVPAPSNGAVGEIIAKEGDEVAMGALLCMFEAGQAGSAPAANAPAPKPAAVAPAPTPAPAPVNTSASGAANTTPASAKMIAEKGLNAATISATGPKGNILKEDVQAALAKPAASVATSVVASSVPPAASFTPAGDRPLDPRGEERVKMSKLRKIIATRLKDAQNTAAMLTTFNEVNMTPMMAIRAEYKDIFEKRYGCKLGFMSFFVKAVTIALKELPAVNGEIYGDEIIYKNYYDIGIAVGTPQGLVVPVLRNADTLSFAEIEGAIADFGKRARDGKLTIAEMQGGTFTITNGGVFGSLLSTPILNPPQSGILGMHKIQKRPIVDGDGNIVVGDMMYLAHSYDHRIIDGREAVTFLVRVKELLETPSRLLLNV